MYLLNLQSLYCYLSQHPHLHSTMYLLNPPHTAHMADYVINLHSTMYLLNQRYEFQ